MGTAAAVVVAEVRLFPRLNHLAEREPPDKVITAAAAMLEMAQCRQILAAAAVVVVLALLATRQAERTQLQTAVAVVQDLHTQSLELQLRMAVAVAVVVRVAEALEPVELAAVAEEQIKLTAFHQKQEPQTLAAAVVVRVPLSQPRTLSARPVAAVL